MNLQQRINAFVKLGEFLKNFNNNSIDKGEKDLATIPFYKEFKNQIKIATQHNGWFTQNNIIYAIKGWAQLLTEENILKWLTQYDIKEVAPKTVAIIMAGNIPLVGFHDFLSVLISGHHVVIKQSNSDKQLLPFLSKYLEHIEPKFKGAITFTENKLEKFDAVIATGSDNTARYFEYYFKDKPSIIRKNRNSVAILTGKESEEELKALSEDVFRYYGLGCRNVSKLFVPKDYNFDDFFKAIYDWHPVINDAKYANNYDYNKAVYLMSEFDMLENGFLMLKEDESYGSPIATLFYEYYTDTTALKEKLTTNSNSIQCIVGNSCAGNMIPFGQTQKPKLWDYADGVDTIDFLLKKK